MRSELHWHVGLTHLVPAIPGGRWLCGFAIFAGLIGLFTLAGVFDPRYEPGNQGIRNAALFFSVIVAYIIPVFHYISERTAQAIGMLTPVLDLPPNEIQALQARIYRKPQRWCLVVLAISLIAGLAHNLLLAGTPGMLFERVLASTAWLSIFLGTLLTWLIMTPVIAALLDNAGLVGRLAQRVSIDLLSPERLRPFATVGVMSTLSVIGALAAFPIIVVDDSNPAGFFPGLLAVILPMFLLAIRPIWPVHRRLVTQKRLQLDDLNRRIARTPPADLERPETLAPLSALLAYRREIRAAPEWPFDVGTLTRLLLYMIIPPLTWVGAALMERFVDTVL